MQEQQSITTENRTIRERLEDLVSPELEYLLGAFGMYVDLAILVNQDILPEGMAGGSVAVLNELVRLINMTRQLPLAEVSLLGSAGFYGGVMAHGAWRVSIQRVPMLKAWAKVFLIPKLRGGK